MIENIEKIGATELDRVLVDALTLAPDAVLIDRPDWVQLTTPSRPYPSTNGVFLARLAPELADARIAEVRREHVERGAGMRWFVGQSSSPEDLSARLLRADIPILATALGMHMPVPERIPELPKGLELRRVGFEQLSDYGDINARAWERGAAFRRECEAFMRGVLDRGDETMRAWIVYADKLLVGTACLSILPGPGAGLGYFQGAAILRSHRRRGMYQGLIDHRFGVLHGLGIKHAVIWADESTSAGVCQRAGFVPKSRGVFHELPQPEPD